MCPACMASAVFFAGGVLATGGLTALMVKISRSNIVPSNSKITAEHEYLPKENAQ